MGRVQLYSELFLIFSDTQIVTAVSKLIYKYYNDGDVYDNTHGLKGWAHDLSSYANWLSENTDAGEILNRIFDCSCEGDYEKILKDLADKLLSEEYLEEQHQYGITGTIYVCSGKFRCQ